MMTSQRRDTGGVVVRAWATGHAVVMRPDHPPQAGAETNKSAPVDQFHGGKAGATGFTCQSSSCRQIRSRRGGTCGARQTL